MAQVSIVTPVYNGASFLPGYLSMLAAQDFSDFELIVVDDGSTDATAELLRSLQDEPRLRFLPLSTNVGAAAARNAGLEACTGRYVCFLDVDDYWAPDKLLRQWRFMEDNPCVLSYMAYERVDTVGRVLSQVQPPPEVAFENMLKSNFVGNLTAMARRDALADLHFESSGHEDYIFWLQLLRGGGRALRVPAPASTCRYLVHGASLSANKLRAAGWQWQIYREFLRFGRMQSAWYMAHYAAHSLAKRRRGSFADSE